MPYMRAIVPLPDRFPAHDHEDFPVPRVRRQHEPEHFL
jgi:hypothetical protein